MYLNFQEMVAVFMSGIINTIVTHDKNLQSNLI
jgi:hypothetical protein